MAKKVLILSSSPRRGGNSDTLCDEFMRGAAESNHEVYNPQNEMFRLLGTKRSFSQNETFFFSHPYPALFRLISHF